MLGNAIYKKKKVSADLQYFSLREREKKTGLEHRKRKDSLINARKLFLPVSFIFLKTR